MEKFNGKIKEYYDNGILKFEGSYLNGIENGKIKDYYENGNLKSERQYLNGIKKGKINQYDLYGKLINDYYSIYYQEEFPYCFIL